MTPERRDGDKPREHHPRIRVGVVVPLANEAETINEFLSRLTKQLGPDDRVFCILDNASKDNTRALVQEFSQQDPRVMLVWAPDDRCVMDAYFRGYREAYEAGAEWILEMDGGMSHQPEEIAQYLAVLDKGYDYVGGCPVYEWRFAHRQSSSPIRKLGRFVSCSDCVACANAGHDKWL